MGRASVKVIASQMIEWRALTIEQSEDFRECGERTYLILNYEGFRLHAKP